MIKRRPKLEIKWDSDGNASVFLDGADMSHCTSFIKFEVDANDCNVPQVLLRLLPEEISVSLEGDSYILDAARPVELEH